MTKSQGCTYTTLLTLLACIALSACAAEGPSPTHSPTAQSSKTLWRFYVHVGCDGTEYVSPRTYCVSSSARDSYVAGDAAATDIAAALQTTCAPLPAIGGTDVAGYVCKGTWSCAVADEALFEGC